MASTSGDMDRRAGLSELVEDVLERKAFSVLRVRSRSLVAGPAMLECWLEVLLIDAV